MSLLRVIVTIKEFEPQRANDGLRKECEDGKGKREKKKKARKIRSITRALEKIVK